MRYKKKRFRALIINKKTIMIYFTAVSAAVIVGAIFSSLHIFSISDEMSDIFMSAIDCGIPSPEESEDSLCADILGFDITDISSIIYSNPVFFPISYSAWDIAGIGSGIYNDPPSPSPAAETGTDKGAETAVSAEDTETINISRGMDISNATDYNVDAQALSKEPLEFKITKQNVEVLIEHTHTTEAYSDNGSGSDRNLDETKNVIAVGEKICEVLNEHGIKTVHDKTIHDYPSYNGAYGRSLTTVKNNMKQYPDIKVVLDVHRDSIERSGKKLKVCADIDGETSSQVMLVIGTNAMGLSHDKWRENLKFAAHIQAYANEKYPKLMRPLNLRQERFNMHTSTGSLIVEVGSSGNTLEEALKGAERFATCLAGVLEGE